MRKLWLTETQIVAVLKEADAGKPVKEICLQQVISDATYYKWKSKYGGTEASDLKRVKELEAENERLKCLFADVALENAAMKYMIAKKLSSRMCGWKRHGIWWWSAEYLCAEPAVA